MADTAYGRICDALERHGSRVKHAGQSKVMAQCPAHDDDDPSLAVTGIEGQALIYCHTGCHYEDVLAALNLTKADLFDTRRGADYRYDDGRNVHRDANKKKFRQSGNTKGTATLYRLAQVREAVAAGRPVFVVEGEKDVHALETLGVAPTCSPMGAGKAHKCDWTPMKGAQVLVIADRDEPGERHARQVRDILVKLDCAVGVFQAKVGKDAADHIAAGYVVADFVPFDLAEPAAGSGGDDEDADDEQEPAAGVDNRSTADILVDIAESLYTFGATQEGEAFGVPKRGPKLVQLVRGGKGSLRAQLAREYRRRKRKVAGQQALASAMLVIEGIAQEAEPTTLYQRVARRDGAHWLDLGDQTGRAVKITADGWSLQDSAPVLFRRTALTAALPEPAPGGDLGELWPWLNVTAEDRPLIAAALAAMLYPSIPHPVLGITGEQGTGKTTATKVLVSILDPSPVPCRKAPKDAEAWVTAAAGSWVVALENLSYIPEWLSDSLCRAVTGDGDVRRKLYTDGELAVFSFRRCIVANGIDFGALRGDLGDRMLPIELDVIGEEARRDEDSFWPGWEDAHPRILGAVLTLTAAGLRALPSVRLDRKPRMADFARILACVDQVLGTKGLARYLDKQAAAAVDSLTGDPFVVAMLDTLPGTFTGTAAELLDEVTPAGAWHRSPKGWPDSPRKVTTRLRRQAPVMRKAGWLVSDDEGKNHDKIARWTITTPHRRDAPISDPQDPQDPQSASDQEEQRGSAAGQPRVSAGQRGSARAGAAQHGSTNPRRRDAPTSENTTAAGHAGHAGQESGHLSCDPCPCGQPTDRHSPRDFGPCVKCEQRTHRYGPGGRPVCHDCTRDATEGTAA